MAKSTLEWCIISHIHNKPNAHIKVNDLYIHDITIITKFSFVAIAFTHSSWYVCLLFTTLPKMKKKKKKRWRVWKNNN